MIRTQHQIKSTKKRNQSKKGSDIKKIKKRSKIRWTQNQNHKKNETHEVRTKASQWSRPSAWIPHKNNGVDLGLKELIFSVVVNLDFHCGGWSSSLSPKSERERERTERWEINCCRRIGERKERGRAGKYGIYGGWLRFDFSGCMFFKFMNYEKPIPHFNFVFLFWFSCF